MYKNTFDRQSIESIVLCIIWYLFTKPFLTQLFIESSMLKYPTIKIFTDKVSKFKNVENVYENTNILKRQ